jgi:hypothetical protein
MYCGALVGDYYYYYYYYYFVLPIYRRTSMHLLLNKLLLDVCVICEIVTRPEDEPNDGSKHVGV